MVTWYRCSAAIPKDGPEAVLRKPVKDILHSIDTQRQAYQACGTIFASLKFHPFGDRWKEKKLPPARNEPAFAAVASTETTTAGDEASLGAFARAHKSHAQRTATFRNETLSKAVLTYMMVYMFPGAFVHLRCTVPEEFSGDAQSLCEQVSRLAPTMRMASRSAPLRPASCPERHS